MAIAAVPPYLGNKFDGASPGLRFGMYLELWGQNEDRSMNWTTQDWRVETKGEDHQQRRVPSENKNSALQKAARLCENDRALANALSARTRSLAKTWPTADTILCVQAEAIAPFTTGLGNEHPLENGFAFLNPYGLPYLPGSGIKGVLRHAARELESGDWGEQRGWNKRAIDALFGRNANDELERGALMFWDVIPKIRGDSLNVEVMTAHQTHYYQNKASPHDSGSPNPIFFLTVPPGSSFEFYVVCDRARSERIAPELVGDHWKVLINAALEHAFRWLGFGAKTAVGYGAMTSQTQLEARKRAAREREGAEREATAVAWSGAQIKYNRANKSVTVEKDGKSATAIHPKGEELLNSLSPQTRRKVLDGQFVRVTAYVADRSLVRVSVS